MSEKNVQKDYNRLYPSTDTMDGLYQRQIPVSQPPPPYSPPRGATNIIYVIPNEYGPSSMTVDCPSCLCKVQTNTSHQTGKLTWIAAGFMAAAGLTCLFPCLGVLPFFVPQCKDVKHKCPNCNVTLGKFRRV